MAVPEALAIAGVIGLSAAWAASSGTIPGGSSPIRGPLLAGIAWAGVYVGLVLAYAAAPSPGGASGRAVGRKIGLGLLLALLATHLCRLLATTLVHPETWDHLFYLRRLIPPGWVAFWCAALLPVRTRAVVRAGWASAQMAPLPQLVVLLASAAILVSGADLAFEWSGGSPAGATLKGEIISQEAWAGNVLILFSAYVFVLAVTSNLWAALLLVSPPYVALGLATLLKVRYLHSAVQPLDLTRIPELLPFLGGVLGTGGLAAVAGALAVWLGALVAIRSTASCPLTLSRRLATGGLSLMAILVFPVAYFQASALPDTVTDSYPAADALLIRFKARGTEFKEMARVRGFFMSFISELPAAFAAPPPDYSPAAVAHATSRYCAPAGSAESPHGGINLIVYLIESFMDPEDLGFQYTSDPIPNVRALRKTHVGGFGIVPEEFAGSANTEFEALTGMATAFLPEGSVAYRLYLRQAIPSLPRALRSRGYVTTAVQPDPRHFYERERAYRLLGFDRVVWLGDLPDVPRAPRGWWPSDGAVVEAVIQATRGPRPAFVFAFPSSTHFPYDRGTYADSDLDVLEAPSEETAAEVKEYINALRETDRAIGTLIDYFRRRPDSTIIAVLGDHLPPLSERTLGPFLSRSMRLSRIEQARMRRRVPLLVWSNFELPREEPELSVNALPSYLLDRMGIQMSGFLAVSDAVRRAVPVLTPQVEGADARTSSRPPLRREDRSLVADYRLLQHDLLLGEQYSLQDRVGRSCSGDVHLRAVSSP